MAFIQFSSIQFEYNQWKTAPFKIYFQRKCQHLFAIFKKELNTVSLALQI
jgi:hypothetical protein